MSDNAPRTRSDRARLWVSSTVTPVIIAAITTSPAVIALILTR